MYVAAADAVGWATQYRELINTLSTHSPHVHQVKVVEKHLEHPVIRMTGKREWKDEDSAA